MAPTYVSADVMCLSKTQLLLINEDSTMSTDHTHPWLLFIHPKQKYFVGILTSATFISNDTVKGYRNVCNYFWHIRTNESGVSLLSHSGPSDIPCPC